MFTAPSTAHQQHTPLSGPLDQRLGPDASKIKRAEHVFPEADVVGTLVAEAGFEQVNVNTVTKRITFPSVLEYVRFQLIATPMASLLSNRDDIERDTLIEGIAFATQSLLNLEMLHDGHFSFPQEAHVVTAVRVS